MHHHEVKSLIVGEKFVEAEALISHSLRERAQMLGHVHLSCRFYQFFPVLRIRVLVRIRIRILLFSPVTFKAAKKKKKKKKFKVFFLLINFLRKI
jgi:hypothetical protein